jgi:hypothetical protein
VNGHDVAARLDLLVPELREGAKALVQACGEAGLLPRVTSTLRSHNEQVRLYRKYQAGAGGFPVAPPGLSAHEYGLAFDMVVSPITSLRDVGATWLDWGGGWSNRDAVHFELRGASDLIASAAQGDQSSLDSLYSITDFIGGMPLPLMTAFIPTKTGDVTKAYMGGAFGAAIEEVLSLLK